MLEILLTTDGFTILSPLQCPRIPIDGFIVGIEGLTLKFTVTEDTTAWHECVNEITRASVAMLLESDRIGIGGWLHKGEEGDMHLHLDVVVWLAEERLARAACIKAKQIAYWNVKEGVAHALAVDDEGEARTLDEGGDE